MQVSNLQLNVYFIRFIVNLIVSQTYIFKLIPFDFTSINLCVKFLLGRGGSFSIGKSPLNSQI